MHIMKQKPSLLFQKTRILFLSMLDPVSKEEWHQRTAEKIFGVTSDNKLSEDCHPFGVWISIGFPTVIMQEHYFEMDKCTISKFEEFKLVDSQFAVTQNYKLATSSQLPTLPKPKISLCGCSSSKKIGAIGAKPVSLRLDYLVPAVFNISWNRQI